MARIDHTACTHPRTPAGRRACRDAGRVANVHMAMEPKVTTVKDAIAHVIANPRAAAASGAAKTEAWIMTSGTRAAQERVMARRRDNTPKRIQPRRSGARVSGAFASCVQAALHIDAHGGRCACGWAAAKAA